MCRKGVSCYRFSGLAGGGCALWGEGGGREAEAGRGAVEGRRGKERRGKVEWKVVRKVVTLYWGRWGQGGGFNPRVKGIHGGRKADAGRKEEGAPVFR